MAGIEANEIEGLSSVELIARMYRGAIDFVTEARTTEDETERRQSLARAVSIVDVLQDHLDLDAGGEIATNLSDLYDFVRSRLLNAEGEAFESASAEAVGVLDRLVSGWDDLALQTSPAS